MLCCRGQRIRQHYLTQVDGVIVYVCVPLPDYNISHICYCNAEELYCVR